MKNLILLTLLITFSCSESVIAQHVKDSILEERILKVEKLVKAVNVDVINNKQVINVLKQQHSTSADKIDSISSNLEHSTQYFTTTAKNIEASAIDSDKKITESITRTNDTLTSNTSILAISIVVAFVVVCCFILTLRKRISKKDFSIESISLAQKSLEKTQTELIEAQKKLSEESLSLDSKLIELMEKQLNLHSSNSNDEIDHTLAIKIADEITRIEVNLSRMDASTRGYKQLLKAIERMKETYEKKGYEISSLLGQRYVEGMKVIADFIEDESLYEGTQIITGAKKSQVLFNGELLQCAEITVSQNI